MLGGGERGGGGGGRGVGRGGWGIGGAVYEKNIVSNRQIPHANASQIAEALAPGMLSQASFVNRAGRPKAKAKGKARSKRR
jgi:hypothetical protein